MCCACGGGEIEIPQCEYTLSYTPTWKTFYDTEIDLPSFITWNESERRFEIYSEDPDDIDTTRQTYTIQMTVAVDIADMDPIIEKTMEFELVVENNCLDD